MTINRILAPCPYCDLMARELIEAYNTTTHQLAWLAELLDAARTHNRNGNHLASQELMDTAAFTADDMAHCNRSEAQALLDTFQRDERGASEMQPLTTDSSTDDTEGQS